jgi:hypothetical protein
LAFGAVFATGFDLSATGFPFVAACFAFAGFGVGFRDEIFTVFFGFGAAFAAVAAGFALAGGAVVAAALADVTAAGAGGGSFLHATAPTATTIEATKTFLSMRMIGALLLFPDPDRRVYVASASPVSAISIRTRYVCSR